MAARLTDKSILIAPPESGDWVHVVDISDTTGSPEGTSKRSTFANFTSNITASLTATHVGFGSGGGSLTGSSNFVWDDGLSKLIASSAVGASYFLSNTSLLPDEKNWSISVGTSGNLSIAAVNDAQTISTFALTVERGVGNSIGRLFIPTRVDIVSGLGIGSASFDASSILEASSTSKGFLTPRMTTAQKNAIASPATSLIVFDTDIGKHQYYTGSAWANLEGEDPVVTDRQVAFGDATNSITSSADFTWRDDIKQLALVSSASTSALFENNGQVVDERKWIVVNNSNGDFAIQAINDAGTAITEGILLIRGTGASIDRVSIPHRTSVNGSLVAGSATFEPSAILEADSTEQGFLTPRMTTAQKNAITSPAISLIVFDTDIGKHQYYTGSQWSDIEGEPQFLADSQVAFGSATNEVSSSASFSWNDTGKNLTIDGVSGALLTVENSGEAVDEKSWQIANNPTGDFAIQAVNDAGDTIAVGMSLIRGTGTQVDRMFIPPRTSISGELVVGDTNFTASSVLAATSTTAGFLTPRMTTAQKNAILSPATSLIVFDTDLGKHQYYTGSAWANLEGEDPVLNSTEIAFGSATNEITSSSNFYINSAQPYLTLSGAGESRFVHEFRNGSTNQKRWAWATGNGTLSLNVQSDNGTLNSTVFSVQRTGLDVNEFIFTRSVRGAEGFTTQFNRDASAIAEFQSTSKGLLKPKMSNAQRDAIVSPAAGLSIYNTSTNSDNIYDGTAWQSVATVLSSVTSTIYATEMVAVPTIEPVLKFIVPVQMAWQFDTSLAQQVSGSWKIPSNADTSTIKMSLLLSDEGVVATQVYSIEVSYSVFSTGDSLASLATGSYATSSTTTGTPDVFLTESLNSGNPITIPVSATPQTLSFTVGRALGGAGTPFTGNVNVIGLTFTYDEI